MSSSKKLTCKVTLQQVFICLRPRPAPVHTVYVYTVYLFSQGKGGGKGEGGERLTQGGRAQHDFSLAWLEAA